MRVNESLGQLTRPVQDEVERHAGGRHGKQRQMVARTRGNEVRRESHVREVDVDARLPRRLVGLEYVDAALAALALVAHRAVSVSDGPGPPRSARSRRTAARHGPGTCGYTDRARGPASAPDRGGALAPGTPPLTRASSRGPSPCAQGLTESGTRRRRTRGRRSRW